MFSEQARSRILSWGGKVQYDDFSRVPVLLSEKGFFEYLDSLTGDKFGEKQRLESRYGKYWKQYTSQMKQVRFYLTSIAREWLEKDEEGRAHPRVGRYGRENGHPAIMLNLTL